MVTVRNIFDTLQKISETHTPNDKYENFITAHTGAAAECILIKPRARCRVPWESLVVRKKWENMKIASLLNKRNPTNASTPKLKKSPERTNTYQKEQQEYIQGQMNKIRNSEEKQSWVAWLTVNKVSRRKSTHLTNYPKWARYARHIAWEARINSWWYECTKNPQDEYWNY